jgi:osmotically-inducible protein OsmY
MRHPRPGAAHRTDPEIFVEARNALDCRPTVPSTVHLDVNQGVVTLSGTVRLSEERADAEDAVRDVEGIRAVVDKIRLTGRPNVCAGTPRARRHGLSRILPFPRIRS